MWSCWWLIIVISHARARRAWFNHYNSHNFNHKAKLFADYDRPPLRKISSKGFSFPPYVVFLVVNKISLSPARARAARDDLTT